MIISQFWKSCAMMLRIVAFIVGAAFLAVQMTLTGLGSSANGTVEPLPCAAAISKEESHHLHAQRVVRPKVRDIS
jgi:hypothetical protein